MFDIFKATFALKRLTFSYIQAVTTYWNKLLDVIKPLTYKNNGPILMIQIENEYGVLTTCDHNYTAYLRDMVWNKLGNDTVLYTGKIEVSLTLFF